MKILIIVKTALNLFINPFRVFVINLKRNILREVLIGIGILVSSFSITIALTFGNGIERMSKENMFSKVPATRIKIQGRIYTNPLNKFLGRSVHTQINISWPFIKRHILSIKGVKGVIPIQKVTYPISAEFPIFANTMRMDVIANGLPGSMAYRYMFPYFKREFNWRFEKKGNLVPVLVSEFIVDAFMQMAVSSDTPIALDRTFFTPAPSNGYRGFRFKLNVGSSVFGRVLPGFKEYEAVIVGFTDPDITAGISLPASFVRQTKLNLQGVYIGNTFESAFILIKDATYFDGVVKSLYALKRKYPAGFNIVLDRQVERFREVSKMINKAGKAIKIPILGFSAIVLLLSCLIVYFAFLYLIKRREKEIGLFRFFGSSRMKIIILLVLEAVFVSLICVYAGILLSKYILIKYIPDNFALFLKALPKDLKVILSSVSLNSKEAFLSFFGFDKALSYKIGFYVTAASGISAFIPSLIGSYKGILKSVNK